MCGPASKLSFRSRRFRFGFETTSCASPESFVDELKPICDAMGIDLCRAVAAEAKAPFGLGPCHPARGPDGHGIWSCPFCPRRKARACGRATGFIAAAGAIDIGSPGGAVPRGRRILAEAARRAQVLLAGLVSHCVVVATRRGAVDRAPPAPAGLPVHDGMDARLRGDRPLDLVDAT